MRIASIICALGVGLCALPAVASASAPVSLPTAKKAVERELDSIVRDSAADYADSQELMELITSATVADCDRFAGVRASCEVEFTFGDGDRCEEEFIVHRSRRGHVRVKDDGIWCDSDNRRD